MPSLFEVTARRSPASASARTAVPRPRHRLAPHRGAEDVDQRVVGAPAVRLRHADRGEEAGQVVGEVLGVRRGSVHRRHGLVVADRRSERGRGATPRRSSTPASAPWSGTTSTPPTSRLTASNPRAIGCRGYGQPPLLPPAAGRPRLRPLGSDRPPDGELRVPRRRPRDRRGRGDRPGLRHPGPARHPRRRRHAAHRRPRHALPPRPHRRFDGGLRHRRDRDAAGALAGADPRAGRRGAVDHAGSPPWPTPTWSSTRAATP